MKYKTIFFVFLLSLPLVNAALSSQITNVISLIAILAFIFLFIGYWKTHSNTRGNIGEKSRVGGFLWSVIKLPFATIGKVFMWGHSKTSGESWTKAGVRDIAELFRRIKRNRVSGDPHQERRDELLSDAVLKKAATIGKRVSHWEVEGDMLMQASEKNIEIQISLMIQDVNTLMQLKDRFVFELKELRERKQKRLPYDEKMLTRLYGEKREIGLKLKQLADKLALIEQFYSRLKSEANEQENCDHEEEKLAQFEISELRILINEELTHLAHIRAQIGKSLTHGGDNTQLNALRNLEKQKEKISERMLKVLEEEEAKLADAEKQAKKNVHASEDKQKALDDIKKLASELYKGTQGFGKSLSEGEIEEISEEIRKKIPLLYPTAHKAWFHFNNKSIDDRTKIMLKLHTKLEEIYNEGAFLAENKDRILARIKRLFPAGSQKEKEILGPKVMNREKPSPTDPRLKELDIAA